MRNFHPMILIACFIIVGLTGLYFLTGENNISQIDLQNDFENTSPLILNQKRKKESLSVQRKTASINPNKVQKSQRKLLNGHSATKPEQFINEYNSQWEILTKSLLENRHPSGTEIKIVHHDSYIQIEKNKGRYIEKVSILTHFPSGSRGSFSALIDSQTGKIIKTWDHSLKHPYNYRAKFSPTGTL